jgi:glycosyltransferase involved in cell wall biosynthesis
MIRVCLTENFLRGTEIMAETKILISVNGRFLSKVTSSGVQNWSHWFLSVLDSDSRFNINVIQPSDFFAHGIRGHFWEQFILPFKVSRGSTLLSPANWGPVWIKNQALVIHDLLPITNPSGFSRIYRFMVKFAVKFLFPRMKFLCTVSENSRKQLVDILKIDASEISVLGAGIRFRPKAPSTEVNRTGFLFVAGENPRKNLSFILDFWSEIYNQTLEPLNVTHRAQESSLPSSDFPLDALGVIFHLNPTDKQLAALYAKSIALLWPSTGEGYGLPLQEAMIHGTPFLSTDTGVASELCVGNSRIVSLEPETWKQEILRLAKEKHNLNPFAQWDKAVNLDLLNGREEFLRRISSM